jgi:hypothetical protein
MKIAKVLQGTLAAVILAGTLAVAPATAHAAVFLSVGIAPPPIPIYAQPIAPGYGYIWTPGYWAYGPDGYYWVDGAWVYPPYVDALWTPGYWGWGSGLYFWHPGYWGRTIGYYGGINYGFGYFGTGFYGGYWNGGHFFYNSAYNHIGFHDHSGFVYNQRVNGFDGRPGGAAFVHDDHVAGSHADFNRGSAVNGNSFANRGNAVAAGHANSFAGNNARPAFNRGNGFTGHANAPAPQSSFNSGSHTSFSAPQGNSGGGGHANFGGGTPGGGTPGGGFHGGGGGGFHGGGGGRR